MKAAVDHACRNAWTTPTGVKTPSAEPEHVASFVIAGVPFLRSGFLVTLASATAVKVTVSGAFVHQSPYVHWPPGIAQSRCELGDLLLVVRPDAANKPKEGVALLIQTKMSASGQVKSPEVTQHNLYSTWPKFRVEGSAIDCELQASKIPESSVDELGRYGLIARTNPPKRYKREGKVGRLGGSFRRRYH